MNTLERKSQFLQIPRTPSKMTKHVFIETNNSYNEFSDISYSALVTEDYLQK